MRLPGKGACILCILFIDVKQILSLLSAAAWTRLEHNRRALETELSADLIHQEAFETKVQLAFAIGEDDERRRVDATLRQVEDLGLRSPQLRGSLVV